MLNINLMWYFQALYEAGEKKLGTDESRFNAILAVQSYEQLNVVFDEYQKISRHSIEQAIKSEMSGDLKDGMLAIGKDMVKEHYSDVIMSMMASQITGVSIVFSVVCLSTDHRKHQSSASLAFMRGIHQWSVNWLVINN